MFQRAAFLLIVRTAGAKEEMVLRSNRSGTATEHSRL